MNRKIRRKAIVFLTVIFLFGTLSARAVSAKESELHAKAALLLDADNNRVLWEKNGYEVLPMASTTKIMTCILALEYGNPDTVIEVSAYAASMPKVRLGMKKGEKYRLEDLVYSLMLESHNDSAVAIAEQIGGSVEEFAKLMNQKAAKLGCKDTWFITPNGLDATYDGRTHATTARDLAVITSYAIKNKDFLKIVGTKNYTFTDIDKKRTLQISNKDRFLDMMEGAIGVKTGFTAQAGYCFVGALKQGDKTFVSVVLGCGWPPNKSWKWSDTKKLMEYGLQHYEKSDIYHKTPAVRIRVENGVTDIVSVKQEAKKIELLLSKKDKVESCHKLPCQIKAPVKAGQFIGYEEYYVNGSLYDRVKYYAQKEVKKWDYEYCLRSVMECFLIDF
ncbi:MAG: D-alanyl-D-alanine carboxypeptidase [Lachnospiraceae bacterium]|jgi:D-alanyl-D-alanine carboxypeptidase (penicillin-binding protein 5/6)|nr:D-alanyl-D-alanine carboxypeptidase [Lachnospiraceae bacterium]